MGDPLGFVPLDQLEDVCELLAADGPSVHLLGGGTSQHTENRLLWVDLQRVASLGGQGEDAEGRLRLGATLRLEDAAKDDILRRRARLLALACGQLGHKQWRRRATMGGVLIGDGPSGGLWPALDCLDAVAVLRSRDGERSLAINGTQAGGGRGLLAPDELVESLRVPIRRGRQLSLHAVNDGGRGPILALLARRHRDGSLSKVRVAFGGGPKSGLAREAEALLAEGVIDEARVLSLGRLLLAAWPGDGFRQVVGEVQQGLLAHVEHMRVLRLRRRRRAKRRAG